MKNKTELIEVPYGVCETFGKRSLLSRVARFLFRTRWVSYTTLRNPSQLDEV